MPTDDRYYQYLKTRGVDPAPRKSFFGKAWAAQISIEDAVHSFFKWFGPRTFIMLLALAVWIWSLLTIFLYVFNIVYSPGFDSEIKNGLSYLVNSPKVKILGNPILYFVLSGGIFMFLLYKYYVFTRRK